MLWPQNSYFRGTTGTKSRCTAERLWGKRHLNGVASEFTAARSRACFSGFLTFCCGYSGGEIVLGVGGGLGGLAASGSETNGRSLRLCEKVCITFPFPVIVRRAGRAPHALILPGPWEHRARGVAHTSLGPAKPTAIIPPPQMHSQTRPPPSHLALRVVW